MYIETIQSHRRHQWIQSVLFSLLAVLGTAATACAVITFANLSNFLTAASANGITGYVAVIGAISCIAALILLAFAQTLAKRSSRLLQLIGRNQQSQLQQHSQQQQQQQYQDDDMQHYQLPIGGIGDLNLDHKKRSVIGIQSNNSGDYYHLSRFNRRKHRASLLSLRSSHSDLRRSSRSSVGNSVKSWWDSVKNYFTNHGNGRRHHQKHQHHLVQLNMVKGSSACAVNAVCEQTTNCDCGQSLPRAISWNRWISGSMAVLWVAAAMGMMTIDNSFRSALGCNLPAIVAISAPSSIPTTAASSTTSRIVASITPKQTSSASTVSRSTLDDKTKIADSFNPLAPAAVVGKADPHHQQSPRTVKMAISKQSMDALARALLTAMDEVTAEQIIEAERSYQQQQQQQHSTPHPQYMQELYRRHFVLAAAPTPTATSSSAASSGTASATVSAKTSSGSATTSKPSTVGKQIGNNRGVSTASSASSPITRISISPDIAHRDNIQSGCSVTRATYALSFVLGALWTVALIHSIVVFSSKTATPADGDRDPTQQHTPRAAQTSTSPSAHMYLQDHLVMLPHHNYNHNHEQQAVQQTTSRAVATIPRSSPYYSNGSGSNHSPPPVQQQQAHSSVAASNTDYRPQLPAPALVAVKNGQQIQLQQTVVPPVRTSSRSSSHSNSGSEYRSN